MNTSRGAATVNDSFNVGVGYISHTATTSLMWLYDCDIEGGATTDGYVGYANDKLYNNQKGLLISNANGGTYLQTNLHGDNYTFSGGEGMGTHEPDTSGNGNDGTWTVGVGGVETLRSATQDVIAHNALNGFSKVLSFDLDGYFDTGITADATTITEVRFYTPNQSAIAGSQFLFGYRDDLTHRYACYITSIAVGLYWDAFAQMNVGVSGWNTFRVGGGKAYLNGAEIADVGGTTLNASASTIWIGAINNYADDGVRGNIEYAKIWKGGVLVGEWHSKNAYNNGTNIIMPDSTGTNNATGTNVLEKYIPALDDGTDDVEGLGLTNPPCDGVNRIHNNAESKIQQTEDGLKDNPFWSANGTDYDAKSWADFIAHANFDNNVVLKWDSSCWLSDALTWAQDYSWTPSAYQLVLSWIGTPCWADALTPLTDVDDEYLIDANGELIFPAGG